MLVFGVVLLVLAALLLVAGVALFANGARMGARPQRAESGGADGAKHALQRLRWKELFSMMATSPKVFTSHQSSHDDRVKASGAFCFLTGIVLVCLAVLAFIAAAL